MNYLRRTKEEAAQTRQALLEAALTVFSKQSYQAARLQKSMSENIQQHLLLGEQHEHPV